jgi:selenocysteine-specific elongation factor
MSRTDSETAAASLSQTSDRAGRSQVIATAGHVDHGKSALILRLTGMDPDRLAEEKRRGLTIDLGFAWTTLPSGREIGFVDVPGHERFIRNMLAGVGPVRLVLFVVAADEGWKPQSEEHLAIVDVLGVHGGVVALTKRDLVDGETLDIAREEVRERLAGTALGDAPIVACSSVTGKGLDEVRAELDAMVARAPNPPPGRVRQFIDRVFSIRGAGTVVTGTLTGGNLRVGEEVEIHPTGRRARVRGLQTHRQAIDVAAPVSRVATNLVGVDREDLDRGDVVGVPGQWRPTSLFEARILPVRGLDHPLTGRGAYKLYAGSAERDARLRFYAPGGGRDEGALARIRVSAPLVLDVHDRFVLREAGRRTTVAGGVVLDVDPPLRPGPNPDQRLQRREQAERDDLAALLVQERGAVRARDVLALTGAAPSEVRDGVRAGGWWVNDELHARVGAEVRGALEEFHRAHPLLAGADLSLPRAAAAVAIERSGRRPDPGLVDALLDDLAARSVLVRAGSEVRLASHTVALDQRKDEVEKLVAAVSDGEPTPPTIGDLVAAGHPREVVEATARAGRLVRISPDLLVTPGFVERARAVLNAGARSGVTVSAFRERLGTSRKYALPLLEWFDQQGVTRRQGDVRTLRRTTPEPKR